MSDKENCRTCRFFDVDADDPDYGDCNRYPPVWISASEGRVPGEWWARPHVDALDFCGEWQEKPEAA